jgi:hypothetical protein
VGLGELAPVLEPDPAFDLVPDPAFEEPPADRTSGIRRVARRAEPRFDPSDLGAAVVDEVTADLTWDPRRDS